MLVKNLLVKYDKYETESLRNEISRKISKKLQHWNQITWALFSMRNQNVILMEYIPTLPKSIKKTGVFVNESIYEVMNKIE